MKEVERDDGGRKKKCHVDHVFPSVCGIVKSLIAPITLITLANPNNHNDPPITSVVVIRKQSLLNFRLIVVAQFSNCDGGTLAPAYTFT